MHPFAGSNSILRRRRIVRPDEPLAIATAVAQPVWSLNPRAADNLSMIASEYSCIVVELNFTCNICGTQNCGIERFGREVPTCSGCQSSVRTRALLAALSREIFGVVLKLCDFPVLKSVRGAGLSDADSYASILTARFHYRNTYFDRPPRLDIT